MNNTLQKFLNIKGRLIKLSQLCFFLILIMVITIVFGMTAVGETPDPLLFYIFISFSMLVSINSTTLNSSARIMLFRQMGLSNRDIFKSVLKCHVKNKLNVFLYTAGGILSVLSLIYLDNYYFVLSYILYLTMPPVYMLSTFIKKDKLNKLKESQDNYSYPYGIQKYYYFSVLGFIFFVISSSIISNTYIYDPVFINNIIKYVELILLTFIPITIFSTIKLYKIIIADEEKYDYNV